jgi:hypothetical protein
MNMNMKKEDILYYAFFGIILIIALRVYSQATELDLRCVISKVDGQTYCVRDRAMVNEAADLLATVVQRMNELVAYVQKKYPNNPDVKRLVNGFNPQKISETLPTSTMTAYSENKGEKIAFCLNKTKNTATLIDVNTLTFVAIHEMAHIMSKSIGHKQEFWQHFKFLLENAVAAGIYIPVDYKKEKQSYCGMNITDNPLFDM